MPQSADVAVLKPDLCVVGGGTAGHAVALAAAALGLACVVVDERARLGFGQAADLARGMVLGVVAPGLDDAGGSLAYAALRERTGRAIAEAAPNAGAERLRALGATVLQARARFLDPRTLEAGAVTIRARRFVIATGARPLRPRLPGLDLIGALTPDSIGTLAACPDRLAILGRTPVALAYARAFRRLGSDVVLCGTIGQPDEFDPELLAVVEAALRRAGVIMRDDLPVRVAPRDAGVELMFEGGAGPVTASHLLVATGTAPQLEGLGLDRAGVRCRDGLPIIGRDLRTTNRRVFAIGDVLGAQSPGAAAIPYQVGLVLRAAFFHQPVRYAASDVPRLVRTTPDLAICGLGEAEARRRNRDVRVLRWAFAENDSAVATGAAVGHVKVLATARGRVLGVGIVGSQAAELIVPWVLALRHGVSLDQMASLPIAPDSLSDASRRAALTFVAGRLRAPWVKRALRLFRLFG